MKKVKVYLIQIWFANQLLQKISPSDMSLSAGFSVLKIREAIAKEFSLIEQQRTSLLKQFGATEGQPLPKENVDEFTRTFNEFLLNNQTEIYVSKIKLSSVINENIKATPDELAASEFIFENDLQEETDSETTESEETEDGVAQVVNEPISKGGSKIAKAELTVSKAEKSEDIKDQILLE